LISGVFDPDHYAVNFYVFHVSDGNPSHVKDSLAVAIAITCLSVVGMVIAIGIAIFWFRCKEQATYRKETSFENKIFQVRQYKCVNQYRNINIHTTR